MEARREPAWDLYSYAIFGLFAFYQVMQWPASPKFLDIYYHLWVAKGFLRADGYTPWAFWQYAPVGSPLLYPPGLSVLMFLFYRAGLSDIAVARVVECLVYPFFLFIFWHVLRKLLNERTAFFGLVIFSSSYWLYLGTVTLPAFTLAISLGILVFSFLSEGRVVAAGLGLGLCLYTHALAGGWVVLSAFFYGLWNRADLRKALATVAIGLFLASPLFIFQWAHRGYFRFVKLTGDRVIHADAAVLLFFLWILLRVLLDPEFRARHSRIAVLTAWTLSSAVLFILLPNYRARFVEGPGFVGVVAFSAWMLDSLYTTWVGQKPGAGMKYWFVSGALLFFFFLTPTLGLRDMGHDVLVDFSGRSLIRLGMASGTGAADLSDIKGRTIYFPSAYDKVVKLVQGHTGPRDLVWSNFGYAGGLVALLADRAMSCGMLPEVLPASGADPLESAKLSIWFKDRDGRAPPGMKIAVAARQLRLVAETDYVFIYENPRGGAREVLPRALIPTPLLSILIVFWLGALVAAGTSFGDRAGT